MSRRYLIHSAFVASTQGTCSSWPAILFQTLWMSYPYCRWSKPSSCGMHCVAHLPERGRPAVSWQVFLYSSKPHVQPPTLTKSIRCCADELFLYPELDEDNVPSSWHGNLFVETYIVPYPHGDEVAEKICRSIVRLKSVVRKALCSERAAADRCSNNNFQRAHCACISPQPRTGFDRCVSWR